MKITNIILGVLLALAAAARITLYFLEHQTPNQIPVTQKKEVTPPSVAAQPDSPTHFPLPQADDASGQPPLAKSDSVVRSEVTELVGAGTFSKLFRSKDIVRHIVVTIDNLPRHLAAVRLLPTNPVSGKFRTTGAGEERLFIAPDNALRYGPFVHAFEMVDTKKLIETYVKLYPLFQQAFKELGYPNDYFNDRLVAVIDHLLAAPEPEGPVALVQPRVVYEFADPALEKDSAGHKILVRMGRDNEKKVKAKLSEIRQQLLAVSRQH